MTAQSSPATSGIVYRALKPDDVPYIHETWLRCWNNSAIKCTECGHWIGMEAVRIRKARISHIIASANVAVACAADDLDAILGFAVVLRGQTAMAYTRASARRLGICAAMFRHLERNP